MPPSPSSLLSGTTPFLWAHLLFGTILFLLPGTAPLSSISSPSPAPFPHVPLAPRHQPSSAPSAALAEQKPFVRPNRIEQRPFVRSCLVKRCRKGGSAGGRRERTGAGNPGKDVGIEQVLKSRGRVLGKGEKTGGRRAVSERGKGVVLERRCLGEGGGGCREKKRRVV